jgi:DNA-binding protein
VETFSTLGEEAQEVKVSRAAGSTVSAAPKTTSTVRDTFSTKEFIVGRVNSKKLKEQRFRFLLRFL